MKRPLLLVLPILLSGCNLFHQESALDLYLRGQLEAEQGRLPEALQSLSESIKKNPRMGLALVARGDIYKQQGNYEQAAVDYKRVTEQEPYNFKAHFQLGVVYQYLKKFSDALVAFEHAVKIRPLDAEANMNLAMSYVQLGQPLSGLVYAQRAVQVNDKSATSHANLGMLYAQLGLTTSAIESFKKSLELDSKQSEVYAELGQVYLTERKFDQARNVLETGRMLAPSAKIHDRLGYTYHMLRDDAKSGDAFKEALKVDPAYYPSLNGLGVLAMTKALSTTPNDVELAKQAIDYWNRSLALNPGQNSIKQLVNTYTPQQ